MHRTSQKPNYGKHVLSVRINQSAYSSLHHLITKAGYKDTASFVRDAVRTKCNEIAECSNGLKPI